MRSGIPHLRAGGALLATIPEGAAVGRARVLAGRTRRALYLRHSRVRPRRAGDLVLAAPTCSGQISDFSGEIAR